MRQLPGRAARRVARARIGFPVTVTVLALVLAACGSSGASESETAQPPTETTTTEPPPTTAAPTTTEVPQTTAIDRSGGQTLELSFPEYQQVLVETDQSVHGSLQTLAGAGSYGALAGQARQSAQTVSDAADRLELITPPDSLSGQHAAIATGLAGFASGLSGVADRVDGQELCATPAVLAELDALPATGEIRAATHAFSAAGGGLLTFVPNLGAAAPERPGNGQHLRPQQTSGRGELTIDNGTGQDAAISLRQGEGVVMSVYIHANNRHTIGNIGDGTYQIMYGHGSEWSQARRTFARDCNFGVFDDTLTFTTTSSATLIEWTTWELTLHSVIGGTASTSPVSPDDFAS